jgi:hypothetical protein
MLNIRHGLFLCAPGSWDRIKRKLRIMYVLKLDHSLSDSHTIASF